MGHKIDSQLSACLHDRKGPLDKDKLKYLKTIILIYIQESGGYSSKKLDFHPSKLDLTPAPVK